MILRLVTVDEILVHYYDPENKTYFLPMRNTITGVYYAKNPKNRHP